MDPNELLQRLDEVNNKIEALLGGAEGEDLNPKQQRMYDQYNKRQDILQTQLANTTQGNSTLHYNLPLLSPPIHQVPPALLPLAILDQPWHTSQQSSLSPLTTAHYHLKRILDFTKP